MHTPPWLSLLQRLLDCLAVGGVLWGLALLRLEGAFPRAYQVLLVLAVLGVWSFHPAAGVPHTRRRVGFLTELFLLARGWTAVALLLLGVGLATKTSNIFSRQVLFAWFGLAFCAQAALRWGLRRGVYWLRSRGVNIRKVLLLGDWAQALELQRRLQQEPWLGLHVVGLVSDARPPRRAAARKGAEQAAGPLAHLGPLSQADQAVRRHAVEIVYICLPLAETAQVERLMTLLLPTHADVHWAPNLSTLHLLNHSVRQVGGQPLLALTETPISRPGLAAKWLLDKALSLLLLLLLSPLLACIAVGIKCTSGGPVLFRQQRTGLNGKTITVYKFRTMYLHREAPGSLTQARQHDTRVTPLGRLLRRTSLDELPQLYNVLQGRMSLVGPRPHALQHDAHYGALIEAYMLRHRMKPGLTGWAQVHNLRGETRDVEHMRARIRYDLYYLNHWSLWLDLLILLLTVRVLCSRQNAY